MKTRIQYIDTLRFIAIISVIAIHSFGICSGEILNFETKSLNQAFHFAVPLFLMITGTLFLNKDINLKEFFKKRFVRILIPLMFFTAIVFILFNRINVFSYYWYSWMILGVIFAIPIINKFIQHATDEEITYYIVIFIIFSIIQQLCGIFKIRYALDISFFITPVSYLILGYCLANVNIEKHQNKLLIVCIALFIISTLIKIRTGSFRFTDEIYTYLDLSLLQIIQASSLFLFIRCLYQYKISKGILENNVLKRFILSVSRSSYGMYLIQQPLIFQVIYPYTKTLHLTGSQSLALTISIIILVSLISWIAVLILSKIPILEKISGYH
ncbi:acyltransferase [Methanobrevibacter sp.]|uniref:acyltransferase n=1 Tax=Methanobrevibacter sp. TaxID=66852 RepID=UPI00386367DC